MHVISLPVLTRFGISLRPINPAPPITKIDIDFILIRFLKIKLFFIYNMLRQFIYVKN